MNAKFSFFEQVKTLFGSSAGGERGRPKLVISAAIEAAKKVINTDERKHVAVRNTSPTSARPIGSMTISGESNFLRSKRYENGEETAHTPSNLG